MHPSKCVLAYSNGVLVNDAKITQKQKELNFVSTNSSVEFNWPYSQSN